MAEQQNFVRVEPTKQYTKSQNKYAPKTKQLKTNGVKYPN